MLGPAHSGLRLLVPEEGSGYGCRAEGTHPVWPDSLSNSCDKESEKGTGVAVPLVSDRSHETFVDRKIGDPRIG